MKEDTLNFVRLLDATERLIQQHEKSKSCEITRPFLKTTLIERMSVNLYNLQLKVREVNFLLFFSKRMCLGHSFHYCVM
jgi:hypothetical protein